MKTLTHLLETHTMVVLALAAILAVALLAAGDAIGVALIDAVTGPGEATELVVAGWRRP
jgi:uncharacterized protein (DUF58 family)